MENSYEEMMLYKAMHDRKIKDMSQKELTEFVSSQIVQCYFMVGYQTYEEKAVGVISAKLVSDLFQCYSYLTCKEIEYCFENGAKGRLGRFSGINLWTFTTWLEKYKTSDIRQQVRKRIQEEQQQKALSADNSLSSADQDLEYAREAFRRYKNGENLEMLRPPYIYKTLQDRGIIHHTREQKLEAMERFKDFKPTGGFNIPEHACQYIIKSQAMAWLLMQEFDKWGEMRA